MSEENIFGANEIYMPKGKFEGITKIQKRDLDQVGINIANGVPLIQTIVAFHKRFDVTRTALQGSGVDEELGKIKSLQEHEKLTNYQIRNQKELGHLIENAIAKARQLDCLSGYQQLVMLYIKQASNQLYSDDNRRNEEILTKLFNELVERIAKDIVEIREWEEDGSYRLLSTRIIEAKKERTEEELILDVNRRVSNLDLEEFDEFDSFAR